MNITLQFSLEDAISSRAIAWFGQGHFSHVDCVLPSGELLGARSDFVGGKPSGVQVRPYGYAKFKIAKQMVIPATEAQEHNYYVFLRQQIGKPYDHAAIWGFVFDRNWREADSWICSELQCAAGEYAHILRPLYLDTNKIVPVMAAVAYSAVGGTITP